MDSRYVARLIALGRIGVGTTLLVAPGLLTRLLGAPTTRRVHVLVRLFAIRDLALGAGAYRALADGTAAAPWVRAGALADAVDATAILLAADELGPATVMGGSAVAGTAAVVGFRAGADVDT